MVIRVNRASRILFSIEVNRINDLKRSAELPLFKHATGRLENLVEISKMLKARGALRTTKMTLEIVSEILILRNNGQSFGRIAYNIWQKHHISLSPSSVRKIVKKHEKP